MTLDIHAPSGGETITLSHGFNSQACPASLYTPVRLTTNTAHLFMTLQETACREGAANGTAHHMKPRDKDDITRHVMAGMPIFGVRHNPSGQHIAQLLVTDPFNHAAKYADGYPLVGGALLVQSFYIHPDHRSAVLRNGNIPPSHGPAGIIFDSIMQHAHKTGATCLIAKIADDNAASLRSFHRHGFTSALASGIDPIKGHAVRYVGAPLSAMGIQPTITGDRMIPSCPA